MEIDGSAALVTGANRGLGAAFIEVLVERGAGKIYAGARDPAVLADAVAKYGKKVVPIRLDVTKPDDIAAVAEHCSDIDLFVCNAGITCIKPFLATEDEASFDATMAVNYRGPGQLTRALAPALKAKGSAAGILYILSMAALVPVSMAPIYSASKAAAMMMAHGVRSELKPHGVSVTLVYPGFMDTPMGAVFDCPKAPPHLVAQRALDGLISGTTNVFPDLYARITEQYLLTKMPRVLDEPDSVINDMVMEFVTHPDAGR